MNFATQVILILFGYINLFYGVRGFHNDPKCGQNHYRQSKIIGGEDVQEAEFPWYVSVQESGQHICGGFIIDSRWILTANHCFRDFSNRAAESPKTISVTVAVHYLKKVRKSSKNSHSQARGKWEQDIKVKRIIRHPMYDAFSESGKYDIALLMLEKRIQWNYGTRPVCLPALRRSMNHSSNDSVPMIYSFRADDNESPSSQRSDWEIRNGEVGVVVGWSSAENQNTIDESILKKVRLTLYDNEECKKILQEKNVTIKTDIDSSVICAGSSEPGFDSCSGDSGSALLVQRNKKWVAIGIVSSGYGKCGSGRPGLYTRINNYYLDWIDRQNNNVVPSILFQKLTASFGSKET